MSTPGTHPETEGRGAAASGWKNTGWKTEGCGHRAPVRGGVDVLDPGKRQRFADTLNALRPEPVPLKWQMSCRIYFIAHTQAHAFSQHRALSPVGRRGPRSGVSGGDTLTARPSALAGSSDLQQQQVKAVPTWGSESCIWRK